MLATVAEAGLSENLLSLVQRVREVQVGHEAMAGQTGGVYPWKNIKFRDWAPAAVNCFN